MDSNKSVIANFVAIPNIPPIASFTVTPTSGTVPLVVTFDASSSQDPDGSIASYTWDFGDGNPQVSNISNMASHTYNAVGSHTATLTVSDGTSSSSSTATIAVNAPPATTYTITDSVWSYGGGTISPTTTVNAGTNLDITLTPASTDYYILDVVDNGVSVKNQLSAGASGATYALNNINTDHTIVAKFTLRTYTVTATSGAGGVISSYTGRSTPAGGGAITETSNSGASPVYTIVPNTGYVISSVLLDSVSQSVATTSYTFTNIGANHTISATFNTLAVPPTITTQPVAVTVNAGQITTFSVIASGTSPLAYQWLKNSVLIT
jgi:hypothetical protein